MRFWYGFVNASPIVAYVSNDGPCGDRITWWTYVVLPNHEEN